MRLAEKAKNKINAMLKTNLLQLFDVNHGREQLVVSVGGRLCRLTEVTGRRRRRRGG